jgi:alpha-mannosidase
MSESKSVSRRSFLEGSVAALGTAVLPSPSISGLATALAVSSDGARRKVIHIIGHSHIDAAWLWPWSDSTDEVLNTFRSALDRISETLGFCYSHSSAIHYRWVERADPLMFEEIRQRVKEGRWEIVGGWPVEPDCNIPATESFARHCLYGKSYLLHSLGTEVKIGFNPDSFGHAWGLPTILRNAGYEYYVFMRPGELDGVSLPQLFWWEGPDGSRILTLRILGYSGTPEGIPGFAQKGFAPGFEDGAFLLGVGDHGGAVTKEQIKKVIALKNDPTLPLLKWSTLGDFFAAVRRSSAMASLPVVRVDLEHHARGCYAANGDGKILNRRAERALVEAETVSTISHFTGFGSYPLAEYDEAWWKVTFNQFHDMLAGTSLHSDYQDVRDSLGWACETAQTAKVETLERMARHVDMSHLPERAVLLFNSLPWPRKALFEVILDETPQHLTPAMHLVAKDGTTIPAQWRPSPSMTNWFPRLAAYVELPPCGYKVFELAYGDATPSSTYQTNIAVSNSGLGISSLKASDGTELLTSAVGLVVIADTSDTWGHGISEYRDEIGRPQLISSELVEEGPVTRITRQYAKWQNSEIFLNIREFAGADFVELHFVINWNQREQILKLEIPTTFTTPKVFAKVPGAAIERSANGEEEPCQDWIAIEGEHQGADYTVALLNAGTYSYDCLAGLLRTVVIRSAPFARHNPNQVPHTDEHAWQDQGRQERRFWLLAQKGAHLAMNLDRRANELQSPADYVTCSRHAGTDSWERSFLEVSPNSIEVLAVKRAEAQDGAMIIRLQQRGGERVRASVKSAALNFNDEVSLEPWEIKTFLLSPAEPTRKLQTVSIMEK